MKIDNIFLRYLSAFIIIPVIYVGISNTFNQRKLVTEIKKDDIKKNKSVLIFNHPVHPESEVSLAQDKLHLFFKTLPRKEDYKPLQLINTSDEIMEFGNYFSKLQRKYPQEKILPFLKKCNQDKTIIKVIRDFCLLKISEL